MSTSVICMRKPRGGGLAMAKSTVDSTRSPAPSRSTRSSRKPPRARHSWSSQASSGHVGGRGQPDPAQVVVPEQPQRLVERAGLQVGVPLGRGGVDGAQDRGRGGRSAAARLGRAGRRHELVAVHLQPRVGAGEGRVGVEDLRRGDLAALDPGQRLEDRAGPIEPGQGQLAVAVDEHQLAVGDQPRQAGRQAGQDGHVLAQRAGEGVGGEVAQPAVAASRASPASAPMDALHGAVERGRVGLGHVGSPLRRCRRCRRT